MLCIVIISAVAAVLSICLIMPQIRCRLVKEYIKKISPESTEKYRMLAVRSSTEDVIKKEFLTRLSAVCAALFAGALITGLLYFAAKEPKEVGLIERPAFGSGAKSIALDAVSGSETVKVDMKVKERDADDEELDEFMKAAAKEAFEKALSGNISADEVKLDLSLPSRTSNGAELKWEIHPLAVMSSSGKIRDGIPEEGTDVKLTVTVYYGEYEESFDMHIAVFPKEKKQTASQRLTQYINDEAVYDDEYLSLPDEYNDKKLAFFTREEKGYETSAVLSAFAAVLIWLLSSGRKDRQIKKRQGELKRDYPGIVSRLSVLLASGMPVTAAWKRIGSEYEAALNAGGKKSAGYDEVLLSVKKLENTGQIEDAFMCMAARCDDRDYRRLSASLLQSLKKGSVLMGDRLSKESDTAFEMRKENARIMGQKANGKLMIPSFMLMCMIMAIVMFPVLKGL